LHVNALTCLVSAHVTAGGPVRHQQRGAVLSPAIDKAMRPEGWVSAHSERCHRGLRCGASGGASGLRWSAHSGRRPGPQYRTQHGRFLPAAEGFCPGVAAVTVASLTGPHPWPHVGDNRLQGPAAPPAKTLAWRLNGLPRVFFSMKAASRCRLMSRWAWRDNQCTRPTTATRAYQHAPTQQSLLGMALQHMQGRCPKVLRRWQLGPTTSTARRWQQVQPRRRWP